MLFGVWAGCHLHRSGLRSQRLTPSSSCIWQKAAAPALILGGSQGRTGEGLSEDLLSKVDGGAKEDSRRFGDWEFLETETSNTSIWLLTSCWSWSSSAKHVETCWTSFQDTLSTLNREQSCVPHWGWNLHFASLIWGSPSRLHHDKGLPRKAEGPEIAPDVNTGASTLHHPKLEDIDLASLIKGSAVKSLFHVLGTFLVYYIIFTSNFHDSNRVSLHEKSRWKMTLKSNLDAIRSLIR